jgi:very-short-patch-repair endonuclease
LNSGEAYREGGQGDGSPYLQVLRFLDLKKTMHYKKYEAAKLYARELRKDLTPAEAMFWDIVKKKQVYGKKFLRQFPIAYERNGRTHFFIADFYCAEAKLVVEIDGTVHDNQQEYDALRTEVLNFNGLSVLRFTNDEIKNSAYVVNELDKLINVEEKNE